MKRILALVFISAVISGCGQGTGTGNPLQPDPLNNGASASRYGSVRLMDAICYKLSACHDLKYEECTENVVKLDNIDLEVGLPIGRYLSYQAVILAETRSEFTVIHEKLSICLAEQIAYTCDNTRVQNAYQKSAVQPFVRVADMIPQSCQEIFK